MFDLLGIKFSVNLDEMMDLNYNNKMEQIVKLIKQWKNRKLTPLGKLSIIKTLFIPKMNHLILTLPNPPTHYIKNFEIKLYEVLWDGKLNKIKKAAVIQDYKDGGLKMIEYFLIALKSSWTRPLISSTDSKWKKLFESDLNVTIPELMNFGIHFVKILKDRTKNINSGRMSFKVGYWFIKQIFQNNVKTYQMTTYGIIRI